MGKITPRIFFHTPDNRKPGPEQDKAALLVMEAVCAVRFPGKPFELVPVRTLEAIAAGFTFDSGPVCPPGTSVAFGGLHAPGTVDEGGTLWVKPAALVVRMMAGRDYEPYRRELERMKMWIAGALEGRLPVPFETRVDVLTSLEGVREAVAACREAGIVVLDFETKPVEPGLRGAAVKEASLNHLRAVPTVLGMTCYPGHGWALPLDHPESPFKGEVGYVATNYHGGKYAADREMRAASLRNGVRDLTGEAIREVLTLFDDPGMVIVGHNLKFDLRLFNSLGLDVGNIKARLVDTVIMANLLDDVEPNGLKEITARMWPRTAGYGEGMDYAGAALRELAVYCVADTDLTLRLHNILERGLHRDPKLYRLWRNLEGQKLKLLLGMECRGMFVDMAALDEAAAMADNLRKKLEEEIAASPEVQRFLQREALRDHQEQVREMEAKLGAMIKARREKLEASARTPAVEAKLAALGDPYAPKYPYKQIRDLAVKLDMMRSDWLVSGPKPLNVRSPEQLGRFIYEEHGLGYEAPVVVRSLKDPATGLNTRVKERHQSTDKDELAKLEPRHPLLDKIIDLRLVELVASTYIEGLKARVSPWGTVHSTFSTVKTGRLSSSDPNLQNLPSRTTSKAVAELVAQVKKVFRAPVGNTFFELDLSQAELRWATFLWNVPSMREAYARKDDMHVLASCMANGLDKAAWEDLKQKDPAKAKTLRQQGKAMNFGFVYGAEAPTYQEYARTAYGLRLSLEEAEQQRAAYLKLHPGILKGHEVYKAKARKFGGVRTKFGRFRGLPYINAPRADKRSADERVALNSPVQGSSAEALLFALIILAWRLKLEKVRMYVANTVHDSALGWVPDQDRGRGLRMLKEVMGNAPTLPWFGFDFAEVGMEVDVAAGPGWGDKKELSQKELEEL